MSVDAAPVRSAAGAVLVSAAVAGTALGGAYWVAEHFIRDDLVGALVIPCVVSTVVAIGSLAAIADRGDRWTPLWMIAAWAVFVPLLAATTTALVSLATEHAEYVAHAAVQTAVRSEIAVVFAALVLVRAWLRRRLRWRRRELRASD
jgi:hypothetical protein